MQRRIEAEEFVLVDKAGHERACLGLVDGEPGLALWGSDGQTRARLSLDADGTPSLVLTDALNIPRAILVTDAEGSPLFMLCDAYSHAGVTLAFDSDGPR